jgi:hypothetical protein
VTRQIAALLLFAVTAVGLAKGQDNAEKKVEVVKYPAPGAEDAVAEVETKEARKVLDDFYRSNVLIAAHQAAVTNDADAFSRVIADHQVTNDERFGRGEILTKAQALADLQNGRQHMDKHMHDHVRLVAFGENTVVLTGHSTSILHHDGKLSNGPRLLTEVWVKFDGRWQRVVHAMSDLDGMEDRAKP